MKTIGVGDGGRGGLDTTQRAMAGGWGRGEDAFGRIVRLMKDNERLFADLGAIVARIEQARAYLAVPDCHLPLGLANLSRLKVKHSGLLALLRANRIEALDALGTLGERAA